MEEYELGVDALKKERSTLREELRKTKEKLIMMESVIKTMRAGGGGGGGGGEGESMEDSSAYKHRMETLAKQVVQHVKYKKIPTHEAYAHRQSSCLRLRQVATLEMKELNESQRASHADSQMKLIQEQLRQLESRNEELETKFADVTKANLELQVAERELRDQIVTSVSRDEVRKMEKKIEVHSRFRLVVFFLKIKTYTGIG